DDAGDVLAAGPVLHRDDGLLHQFRYVRTDHVHAENFIVVGAGDHFDETVLSTHGLGAAIGSKWNLADVVINAGGLDIGLGATNPGNFRGGVDDGWHDVVIHMRFLAGNNFG